MSQEKSHDIHDYMKQIHDEISADYQRIQKRAVDDPGTAGDQAEEDWAKLLREWLPSCFTVVTKGRIIGYSGIVSPQIDVLVLSESYPSKLHSKKIYLAAGIVAAFECKTTLKASHIKEAVETARKVKNLFDVREGSPYKELHSPIIYGLLSHSHSWKNEKSNPAKNILKKLETSSETVVEHPREQIDLLCVADLGVFSVAKTTYIGPKNVPNYTETVANIYGKEGAATTSFLAYLSGVDGQVDTFVPVGALLTHLLNKMARENVGMRALAKYFTLTNCSGSGTGFMSIWSLDIYTPTVIEGFGEKLSNGKDWDEWGGAFP